MTVLPGPRSEIDERVLMLAPTGRDGELMCSVLEDAGVRCKRCADMLELCSSLHEGGAALLIAEEALADGAYRDLIAVLAQQPPWSEPPILLLSERGADSEIINEALDNLGNVTVLERPTRVPTLVSAVHSALRSRSRQYQIRSYIAEREGYAEALRAADRRKDEFLATLAHELRNPLAPMRTALEIMRIAPKNESARDQAQSVLERQVRQMARLIDDLLDLSRISHGKLELRREPVTLRAVIDSAIELTRPSIEALGHALEVDLPAEPLHLNADPTRLSQVFSNLLNNAAKYTPHSGHIRLSAERRGDEVCVRIKDNGIGIAPENLQRVFEMFTQVGRSLEQSRGGLGVGLSLSQWLVRLHGGAIEAHSDGLNRGSEFVVRLPLAAPAPAAKPLAGSTSARPHAIPKRVLVCDDNRDFADSLASMLRLAGNEVCVTYDGLEAVAAAGIWRPDVVLLDIGMPHLNGYETARRIGDGLAERKPLLVAITGWGQEEDRRRSSAAGFAHHFVKPVDPATIIRVVAGAASTDAMDDERTPA
ncbi:MAG TPA: ATP-binding protein [Burkholderiales bacterium]|nr:ATP-binding protein [Burkholderiales bacterium]